MPVPKESRRKRLSDFPWVKIHWSDLMADIAGLSEGETKSYLMRNYQAWRSSNLDGLDPCFRLPASELMDNCTANQREKKVQRGTTRNNDEQPFPTEFSSLLSSSSVLSSLSSLSSSLQDTTTYEEESTPRVREDGPRVSFSRFLRAGPPTWLNHELAAWREWQGALQEGGAEAIIEGAAAYRDWCEQEPKTENRFVKRPDNFLRSGSWSVNYQQEEKIGSSTRGNNAVSAGVGRYADPRTRERRAAESDGYIELTAPDLQDED